MAAWDNVKLPGAPDAPSYAAPMVNFAPLGELGNAYYQGQEQQRQNAIRNAFAGGFPTVNGQPDYLSAAQTLYKLGAIDQANALVNLGGGQAVLQRSAEGDAEFQRFLRGGGDGGTSQPTSTAPPDTTARVPTSNNGVIEAPVTAPVPDQKLSPEEQISPRQVASAEAVPGVDPRYAQGVAALKAGQGVPTAPGVQAGQLYAQQQPQPQQAPPAQTAQGVYQPSPSQIAAAAARVPPNVDPRFKRDPGLYATVLENRANAIANNINAGKVYGKDLKGDEDKVKFLRDEVAAIRKELAPTGAQRDIQEDIEGNKARQKAAADLETTRYKGIFGGAAQWQGTGEALISQAKSVLNQPETVTGFASGAFNDVRRATAMFGDRKGAQYYDAINKLNAMNVLTTIGELKSDETGAGEKASRIFSVMADQAAKTGIANENTWAGNLYLAEMQDRIGKYKVHLRDLADDYKAAHGDRLDTAGFNKVVTKDLQDHPLFTKQELTNPSLLGAPTSPYNDINQTAAWIQKMGLKPNDAIRQPSGRLIHVKDVLAQARPQ